MAMLTVHVIEDDDAVRDSLTLLLDAEGLKAIAYPSADAFLSAVSGPARGCVLADVQMAGVDGVALLGRLKARGLDLPVVLMTGRPSADLSAKALREGAVTILDKPFSSEALLEALQGAVSAAR